MEQLRDHGAERAARHDDGAFRAKRTTGTDRNCRSERLEERDFWFDAAAIDQNCFDCFRYAMAADSLRAKAGHYTDDERAANRHENAIETQMVAGRGNHSSVPAAKIKEIGEKAYQTQQHESDERAEHPDEHGEARDRDDPQRGCEVSQCFVVDA